MTHLLVTNDFPPKVGGIQAYLWELWRRLDPDSFAVLTASSHPDARAFDREQALRGIRIERVSTRVLVPGPQLVRRIRDTRPSDRRRPCRPRSGLPPRSHRSPARDPLRRDAPRRRGRHPRTPARRPTAGRPRAAAERAGRLGRRLSGHRGTPGPAPGAAAPAHGGDPPGGRPRPVPTALGGRAHIGTGRFGLPPTDRSW